MVGPKGHLGQSCDRVRVKISFRVDGVVEDKRDGEVHKGRVSEFDQERVRTPSLGQGDCCGDHYRHRDVSDLDVHIESDLVVCVDLLLLDGLIEISDGDDRTVSSDSEGPLLLSDRQEHSTRLEYKTSAL